MYYEEKIVDGVLSWRCHTKGAFIPLTAKQLTEEIEKLRKIRGDLNHLIYEVTDLIDDNRRKQNET